MGLLSKLVMLPLAPVTSVVWLAEQLEQQAYQQMYSPTAIRRELSELDARHADGELGEESWMLARDELLERLDESLTRNDAGSGLDIR